MEQEYVTIGFLLHILALRYVFGIQFYTRVNVQLKELDLRLKIVEKQDDTIMQKLDTVLEEIGDLKIELQNKQNR